MKRFALALIISMTSMNAVYADNAIAYNFGDFRSETLTAKAWEALNEGDLEAVLAYTNKCIELYGDQARKMQSSLSDFPQGSTEEVFAYWALNDVATSFFVQGEAYRKAEKKTEALEAYKKVTDEYAYGQSWDSKGWFWKPADAAKEKIAMVEAGSSLDFGDYSSSFLTAQAWKALRENNAEAAVTYVDKVVELYEEKAKNMQETMTEFAWESKEDIFSKWALNDVGTAYFIKGEILKKTGQNKQAKKAYQELVENFYYAQCWDPNGWFWKPAEAAQQSLDELGEI